MHSSGRIFSELRPLWLVQRAGAGIMRKPKLVPLKVVFNQRSSLLQKLIKNNLKDDSELPIKLDNPTRSCGIFDKISRPKKRRNVLNSLFIENITDVISTGDVAPELKGRGIEIIGVNVSIDYSILRVYWQIPPNMFKYDEGVHSMLAAKAPQIRAELISRNIVGKVPLIQFIRDETNERSAAFEEALASADLGPEELSKSVPDQDFLKEITKFNEARGAKSETSRKKEKCVQPKEEPIVASQNPKCMKSDILDLDHGLLMNKVIEAKKKTSLKVVQTHSKDDDLFSKIPGVPLQNDTDRAKMLKQFCSERKALRKANRKMDCTVDNNTDVEIYSSNNDYCEHTVFDYEPDYYDEESDLSLRHDSDDNEIK